MRSARGGLPPGPRGVVELDNKPEWTAPLIPAILCHVDNSCLANHSGFNLDRDLLVQDTNDMHLDVEVQIAGPLRVQGLK